MAKPDLLARVGNMQQVASIRPLTYTDGRSAGLPAYAVRNGPLSFVALAGKCLDLAELSYKGVNLSFLAKPGLMGRNHFDTNGAEALRGIMGGFLFTCGLENICAPCATGGKDYPMHGRIRTTPAENLCASADWEGDDYRLRLSGTMREAELFGENLVLRRTIETVYGERRLVIRDTVENESFRPEPMMLLYHFNIGHPLLSENCQVILPTRRVTPREAFSAPHAADWAEMPPPKANEPEYVFLHELVADAKGDTFAAVFNEELSIGLKIAFNTRNLPYFMQWKSTASGDYVMGLEPANSSVYGRLHHEANGDLHTLAPFGREETRLEITLLDGEADLNEVRRLRNALLKHHDEDRSK
jgi:hypothetical protein